MIKRTLEISREPAHLAVQLDQLLILRPDQQLKDAARVPCEDIGLILVDHPQTTYTHQALATLLQFGAGLVVCGRNHLPAGLLLPLSDHTQVVWRVNDQAEASKPLKKRLWQQLIVAKIRNQAANLDPDSLPYGQLRVLANEVKSGDTTNVEGQAARLYWSAWLPPGSHTPEAKSAKPPDTGAPDPPVPAALQTDEARLALESLDRFRRDPEGVDPLNAALNYGYAILRAAVARALVGAGLFPALGLHHSNRSNAFALADDMVEPLRPLADARVRHLHQTGRLAQGLDQPTKAALLELLTVMVGYDGTTGPLMVSLHRYAASLAACYAGQADRLMVPTLPSPPT
jgi:CRISPR-associated protein Cas1